MKKFPNISIHAVFNKLRVCMSVDHENGISVFGEKTKLAGQPEDFVWVSGGLKF